MTTEPGPLADLRVVELGQSVASPFAASLLADLGADVVKVEGPRRDLLRAAGPSPGGVPLWFKATNRGKSLLELDLHDSDDRARFLGMLAAADILIENLLPGALDRLDLGPAVLQAANPDLVRVTITGFGLDGPRSTRRAFARIVEAFAGLTSSTGEPDRPPLHLGIPLADYVAGLFAALAALAGVHARRAGRTSSAHADVAMFECVLRLLEHQVATHGALGQVPGRHGNAIPGQPGAGVYRASDGWVSITAGPQDAAAVRLLDLVDLPHAHDGVDLTTKAGRMARADVIETALGAWSAGGTREDRVRAATDLGVPAAAVNTIAEVVADEHTQARHTIQTIPDPDLGTIALPAVVPRFPGQSRAPRFAGHSAHEDVDAVMARWQPREEER